MNARARILKTALDLGQCTVRDIAEITGLKEATVRATLSARKADFVETPTAIARRGGRSKLWEIRPERIEAIKSEVEVEEAGDDPRSTRTGPPLRIQSVAPELATADDLNAYGIDPSIQIVPLLVQRLLVASGVVFNLSVPIGEGIRQPGFDGRAESSEETLYIPGGVSVWEMSARSDIRAKAKEDFRKRSDESAETDRSRITFVFATTRRFPRHIEWCAERRSENIWADVRVVDADAFSAWLLLHPSIHVWLSEVMGLHPRDVETLEAWRTSWCGKTDPPIPPGLLVAGRNSAAHELQRRASERGQLIPVWSGSREESMAFIAAAMNVNEENTEGSFAEESTLVVKSNNEWARLAISMTTGTLIPDFADADISLATERGLTVLVPLGPGDASTDRSIVLPRIDRWAASEVLSKSGVSRSLSESMAREAEAGVSSLKRLHARNPQLTRPKWAIDSGALVSSLVLIGAWDSTNEADRLFVEAVTNESYVAIDAALRVMALGEDAPLVESAGGWVLVSPEDAMMLVGPSLSPATLARWANDALEAFRVVSEIPASGVTPTSETLRSGITRGAILLELHGTATQRATALRVVSDVLGLCRDARSWNSLATYLPSLAEAEPDTVLGAIEDISSATPEALSDLTSDSNRPGLMWALELLCALPEHASRSCYLMATLASTIDSDQVTSRPFIRLRQALVPWYPQVALSRTQRRELLDGIVQRMPTFGWLLVRSLLPGISDWSDRLFSPTFRPWHSFGDVSISDQYGGWSDIAETALGCAAGDPVRLVQLAEVSQFLDSVFFDRVAEELMAIRLDAHPPEVRIEAWRSLSELIAKHRRFPGAKWALSDACLTPLEVIAFSWAPGDVIVTSAPLFSEYPRVSFPQEDHSAYEIELARLRHASLVDISEAGQDDGLYRLIEAAEAPYIVGMELANDQSLVDDSLVVGWLGSVEKVGLAAHAWLIRSSEIRGSQWTDEFLHEAKVFSVEARLATYKALVSHEGVFDLVALEEEPIATRFWEEAGFALYRSDDVEKVVPGFLTHGQVDRAVHYISRWTTLDQFPDMMLVELLRAFARDGDFVGRTDSSTTYDLGRLLDVLVARGVDDEILAQLDLMYFDAMHNVRVPTALYRRLAQLPEEFVALVRNCYMSAELAEPEVNADPRDLEMARRSFEILRSWRTIPGLRTNGSIDFDELSSWVNHVRGQLAQTGHTKIGDLCIGELLSGSPTGDDGIWPAEPVRNVLEFQGSGDMREGMVVGRLSARGMTTRGASDGGTQERALVESYESDARAVATRWPATARLLRDLAQDFRKWAARQDFLVERYRGF